ncbi:MAG TPA: T9SS type A sorting domain-containing protein [Fermentimonas sp.]|nr:T9SS type A sorting domain-containing protein [Fermentimonas sp.]
MKQKKLKISLLLLLGLGLTGLQAQSLFVKQSNNTQSTYALDDIRKITFSSGNLTVTKKDNTIGVYALSGLRYLSFADYLTSISESKTVFMESLVAFPNPVQNILNIDLTGAVDLNGTITIFTLQGSLVQTKQISEAKIVSLDVSSLPSGIYICCYSNKTEIKTVKFIKQ